MEKLKYIVYVVSLAMLMPCATEADGRFEDADKSNDFLSQTTHQYFDLRHTLPGEPDIDYPIYGEVPRTSFSCANKHEGYYADIESRCQAFRICTHTQNTAGFGFLCPNGTLFSQRHFVCDWYRNVRCEESERFYDKNKQKHVGNNNEMMEKVRQMIEFPMKTIRKALQQNSNTAPRLTVPKTQQKQQSFKNIPAVATSASANTDKVPYYDNEVFGVTPKTTTLTNTQKVLSGEVIKSLPVTNEANEDDIYVNSLGELSTDPNAKFNMKTSRIIAHPKKAIGRNLNFAESINYGLNDYRSGSSVVTENLPKNTRGTKDESILGANLNILKHEIIAELDQPQLPQLMSNARNFQFLSRGFSAQNNKIKSKNSYYYQPPKQTASTVRFSPNELSDNSFNKDTTSNHDNDNDHNDYDKHNDEVIQFEFMPTTEKSPSTIDSFFINSELFDLGSLAFDLGPEVLEETSVTDENVPQQSTDEQEDTEGPTSSSTTTTTTSPSTSTTSTTPATTSTEPTTTTTTTTTRTPYPKLSLKLEAPSPQLEDDVLLNSLDLSDLVELLSDRKLQQQQESIESGPTTVLPSDDTKEKINVNRHAQELFIAGVQLVENSLENLNKINNSNHNENLTTTTTTTTTAKPIITMQITKSEMVTEVNMIESRVRSRRRFKKQPKNEGSSTTTTTTRPRHLRRYMTRSGTTTSTTKADESTEATTASQRQHQRKQRTTRTTTTTTKPVLKANSDNDLLLELPNNDPTDKNENRRIIARNINQSARANNFNIELKKSTRYNQRRRTTKIPVITNRTTATTATTTTKVPTTSNKYKLSWTQTSMKDRHAIIRARGSQNYNTRQTTTTTTPTTIKPIVINEKQDSTPVEEIIAKELVLTINTNDTPSTSPPALTLTPVLKSKFSLSTSANLTTKHNETAISLEHIATTNALQQEHIKEENSLEHANYLPFNELTRAIVDTSILQNYRSNQHLEQQPQVQQQQQKSPPKLYVPTTAATSTTVHPTTKTNIYHNTKNTAPTTYTPSVLIARAEGQRIVPNSLPIPQHLQQPHQEQQKAPYVPLNDFLNNKFGTTQTSTKSVYSSQAQQQTYYPQYQHSQQQQQQYNKPTNPFFTQQQPIKLPVNPFLASHPQQKTQQIYVNQQQQQQQTYDNVEKPQQQQYAAYNHFSQNKNNQHQNQLIQNPSNQHANSFLNVKLPTLSDGLIPIPPTTFNQQTAQRRKDTFTFELDTTPATRAKNIFHGASSYDVPLSSVGRLPNDMQRLRKIIK